MGADAYEVLAICMRYVFAALMVLIVLRAWRITAKDGRRATKLRRLSPQTGIVGELMVISGGESARDGLRYRVILEGSIGSGRRCDVRIRHSSVRARHALFQMTNDGLFVRSHAGARIADGHGKQRRELLLHDGDLLFIGQVRLMLILSEADETPDELDRRPLRRRRFRGDADEPRGGTDHDPDHDPYLDAQNRGREDDLFMTNPAGALRSGSADDYDRYDDDDY